MAVLSDEAGRRGGAEAGPVAVRAAFSVARGAEAGPVAVRAAFSVARGGEQVGALYGEAVGAGL
ncbi:hypothetical protein GGQ11_002788 [Salinibacter ruber]|uniref:hypothetical protein n=1 Tax=Salinibacter ruber TaxID=146919 RepID=UPI00216700F7|nr:hypothetical protein [Salinibacter ruber]MCS3657987.1 hypothetical protein [Salinibacter ruber]